jgi:hypothetical protein
MEAGSGSALVWKLDPDPHWSEKLDSSKFRNFGGSKMKPAYNEGVKAQNGALEGL